jgi:predicted GTPase
VFAKYSHLTQVLPAMGYGPTQVKELAETIGAVPCDSVLIATPIDLARVLPLGRPSTRATYELEPHDPAVLEKAIVDAIARHERSLKDTAGVTHVAH